MSLTQVTTGIIADASVTSDKLASGAAVSNIGAGGITATKLASDAVETAKIKNANVTPAKLSTGAPFWESNGNFIVAVNSTAPSLSSNQTMSFELTSDTSLTIKVRGSDGVTRSVSLTLS